MIYLRSFTLSSYTDRNPNIYPDHVFKHIAGETLFMDRITVLYGNNGSGKSTLLNVIANKLGMIGAERMSSMGYNKYVQRFLDGSRYQLGSDEREEEIRQLPEGSRYIKSEDILYEIKKIQQEAVLREDARFEQQKKGMTQERIEQYMNSYAFKKRMDIIKFAQEKYSNGQTSMQYFEEYLRPGKLYLLDEPETSLSPANQIRLAEQMNEFARLLDSQFIIASHSPFMLGTLQAKIYNLDSSSLRTAEWHELDNMRTFYQFFDKHRFLFK
ncbi:AAA family ATPase [Cohnella hongkongensis]|uniref:AAA family ATPase n=1 Tax=Cohnella hongkongensis TaxID=178337 RepID=A0ABV9FJI8_9BACL